MHQHMSPRLVWCLQAASRGDRLEAALDADSVEAHSFATVGALMDALGRQAPRAIVFDADVFDAPDGLEDFADKVRHLGSPAPATIVVLGEGSAQMRRRAFRVH